MILTRYRKQKFILLLTMLFLAIIQVSILAYYFHAVERENESLQAENIKLRTDTTSMWYCGGWPGVKYPTEQSMRRAFK